MSLSAVEAQRVVAVLEETVEKLNFLGSITPDVLAHRNELSQYAGDEISRIITDQRSLEMRYETLIAQRGKLKGLANKSKYKANQAEIQEVSRALRESTKTLCRNLKDNPNIHGNLLKIQEERSALCDLLQSTIKELRNHGTFDTLVEYVEKRQREEARLKSIIDGEKETSQVVAQLEKDLQRERADHEREVKERKAAIAKLKEEVHDVRSNTVARSQYAMREADAKIGGILRQYRYDEDAISERIYRLQKSQEMAISVHNETVAYLKRKHETWFLRSKCGPKSTRTTCER